MGGNKFLVALSIGDLRFYPFMVFFSMCPERGVIHSQRMPAAFTRSMAGIPWLWVTPSLTEEKRIPL